MARRLVVANELFLDASYAIALAANSDQLHSRAVELADEIGHRSTRLITTRVVLVEIGNALSKLRYRAAAVQLPSSVESDPTIEVVPFTEDLYSQALELFRNRPDKEWGLTDCVSFVVMQAHSLTDALTYDEHFEQAGFRALLLNA
jgi:predicted nucleic acid-binding protein